MPRNQRLGIAAAAIVVIVAAFLVPRPQDDHSSDSTVPSTTTTSATGTGTTTSRSTGGTTTGAAKPRSSARPDEAHIVVVGGKPKGGVYQLRFKHNQTVRIAVTSDSPTTALGMFRTTRAATRSQHWMLIVMVGFTSLGLWLLSSSNG